MLNVNVNEDGFWAWFWRSKRMNFVSWGEFVLSPLPSVINLIEDYLCAPADDLSETDSDSDSGSDDDDDDDDDEAEREVPAAVAESDSEEEGESVDEVSVGLNSSRHDQLQHQYVRADCTIQEARQQEKETTR